MVTQRSGSMLAVLTALSLLLLAAPASAQPTVTVAPNSDLVDGQTVTVTASGYSEGRRVFLSQCTHNAESRNDCDEASLTPMTIGADGTATAQFSVIAGPVGVSGGVCDADNPCELYVQEIPPIGDAEIGFATITFAASPSSDDDDDSDDDSGDDSGDDGTDDDVAADSDTSDERLADTGGNGRLLLGLAGLLALFGVTARRFTRWADPGTTR